MDIIINVLVFGVLTRNRKGKQYQNGRALQSITILNTELLRLGEAYWPKYRRSGDHRKQRLLDKTEEFTVI